MELIGFLVFAAVFSYIHYGVTSADFKELAQKLSSFWHRSESSKEEEISKRLDEAMDRLRERNYVLACRFLRQSNFVTLLGAPIVYGHDMTTCAWMMSFCGMTYVMHIFIADGTLRMPVGRLRRLVSLFYVGMFLAISFSEPGAFEKIRIAYQLAGLVCYIDSALHVPAQMCLSLSEIARCLFTHGLRLSVLEFALGELAIAAVMVISSLVLEYILRERLAAQLRNTDSESMINGFRRMLRGVSDGEVLLNDRLEIQETFSGLNRVLSTNENLQGKAFTEFLLEQGDELERFKKFISPQDKTIENTGAAQCLRASLQAPGACGTRVGVDVFHVALPHLYGCEEAFHLLGMKLDVEAPAIPEAPLEMRLPRLPRRRIPSSRARSVASEQSAASLLQTSTGLEELMLLVNAGGQQDISQIHLKYKERGEVEEAEGEGSAPSLRKLIRPTEWETVRRSIRRFVDSKRGEERRLSRVWVRDFDRPSAYMQVRRVTLKPCREASRASSGHLWIHLRGFQPEEKRSAAPPSELADVDELAEEDME